MSSLEDRLKEFPSMDFCGNLECSDYGNSLAARASILSDLLEIIGEDEKENSILGETKYTIGEIVDPPIRNKLRQELRKAITKYCKGE